jgi:hypothetical protein
MLNYRIDQHTRRNGSVFFQAHRTITRHYQFLLWRWQEELERRVERSGGDYLTLPGSVFDSLQDAFDACEKNAAYITGELGKQVVNIKPVITVEIPGDAS